MLYNYKAVGDLWEQVSCNNSAMVFTTFGMVLDDSITAEQHFKWNENNVERRSNGVLGQPGVQGGIILSSIYQIFFWHRVCFFPAKPKPWSSNIIVTWT